VQVDGGGFLMAYGHCYACRSRFLFDPALVPVVRIDGVGEPLCRYCVAAANPIRIAHGRLPIVPMPGAYIDV
jgi:hypothetical protein